MKNIAFTFLIFLIASSTAFAQHRYQQKTDARYKQIETYSTDKAPKPYIIIGETADKARKDESCVKKMQKKAVKSGGDAIINIDVAPTGAQGMWVGASVLHCHGIVVRWVKAGEVGQTSIDPNDPIPFLMK